MKSPPSQDARINELFALWRSAKNAPTLEVQLAKALERRARRIISYLLREDDPELAQRAADKAFANAHRFRGDCQFSTWFYTIVSRLCWAKLRDRQRRREVSLEDLSPKDAENLTWTLNNDAKLELEKLARDLREVDRQLLAWKLEGYTDEEIGKLAGCTENAAKLRWLKLRRKLWAARSPRAKPLTSIKDLGR